MIDDLSENFSLTILADRVDPALPGFAYAVAPNAAWLHTSTIGLLGSRMFFQRGVLGGLLSVKPEYLLTFANLRYITFWLALLLSKLLGIRFLAHGHGLVKHPDAGFPHRVAYKLFSALGGIYIGYNEECAQSLTDIGMDSSTVFHIDNTVYIDESGVGEPADGTEWGVFFIGRLRGGSNVEGLCRVCLRLRDLGLPVTLHIVGGGSFDWPVANAKAPGWVTFHGAVHDVAAIKQIAKSCRVGCYPGAAGLSVVHMFALGRPPVVHGSLAQHMGPEPAYVKDGVNGFVFEAGVEDSLFKALEAAFLMEASQLHEIAANSLQTYRQLCSEGFASQLTRVISALR